MKLRVRSGGHKIAELSVGETQVVEVKEGQNLSFFYGFPYHTRIRLDEKKQEEFIIVYYSFREYFPGILLDLFKKVLVAKPVSEKDFKDAEQDKFLQKINSKQSFNPDRISLITGFFLSLIYTAIPFFWIKEDGLSRNLSFFIGVVGIISFLMIIIQKRLISLKEYKARILLFGLFSIIALCVLPQNFWIKTILLSGTLVLILRTFLLKPLQNG
ncbi:MAG: hypothetical protein JXR65_02295 [Bacteroidales bacterium]|nr:hypothetical protein [Bacteroidales bacterium]